MGSYALQPPESGYTGGQLFVEGQIHTKAKRPLPGTTFSGKTAIITGSNVGIGLASAGVMLDLHLSHLIMAVRSVEKGEAAAVSLRKAHPKATVDVWELDLLSYNSIQSFVRRCTSLPRLDIAIMNAGIGTMDFIKAPSTGHEQTFQVNYLSTALLAILLLPLLKDKHKNGPARLSVVTSGFALISAFPNRDAVPLIPSFDDPTGWNLSSAQERYSLTKTLELMLVHQLSKAVRGDEVIINAVDPGYTGGTQLDRGAPLWIKAILAPLKLFFARSPEQAAWTYVDAVAVKGPESHDALLKNWEIGSYHPMMYSDGGEKTMERLWEETLQELEFAGVRDIVGKL
ncbi:hypothetical protein BAUCODRAFT_22695 [Baudoinia panamericana UAMH 10762]|uniref:Ketoreductase (KR) domain-containing protein n=1 Tax=Baudoinia panamericana (strain UAMH 10762) TaxID=717646 RepID=M2MM81_BAUPA|nr:uncharacterized protein BAUCODRAFT_22695 [Baudoinia panamericana UAMH 10762]EMC97796.1 hypothetical protein BAUCODRAFT_22695 [Baudoinia panamericana UAMH 10762]